MRYIKLILTMGIVIVVLAVALVCWIIFANPKPLPTNGNMIETMNQTNKKANVKSLQATIFLDNKHVFVPFVSKNGNYGVSYWSWQMLHWELVGINSKGSPHLWKIKKKDPSTYYVLWNISPKDHVNSVNYYLIRKRSDVTIENQKEYFPSIQMKTSIKLNGRTFGFMAFPKDWQLFTKNILQLNPLKSSQNKNSYDILGQNHVSINVLPLTKQGKMVKLKHSTGGHQYVKGRTEINYIHPIAPSKLVKKSS